MQYASILYLLSTNQSFKDYCSYVTELYNSLYLLENNSIIFISPVTPSIHVETVLVVFLTF